MYDVTRSLYQARRRLRLLQTVPCYHLLTTAALVKQTADKVGLQSGIIDNNTSMKQTRLEDVMHTKPEHTPEKSPKKKARMDSLADDAGAT